MLKGARFEQKLSHSATNRRQTINLCVKALGLRLVRRSDITMVEVTTIMTRLTIKVLNLVSAVGLLLVWNAVLYAQTVTIRGRVTDLKGPDMVVATPNGDVKAALMDKTVIRGEQPINFTEIVPGMYVAATATKQADGNFLASAVNVFSEDQRGTSEGHRPLGSAPQSGATMTNATVERIEDVAVQNIKGRLMTLKYSGGEVKVLVPPDVPVMKRIVTDRSALKVGAEVSVQGTRNADGALAATQITIRGTQR
jgi:uncharacterized protein DUF5666